MSHYIGSSIREDVMDRKEFIQMAIESPLYFTLPLRVRLDLLNRREQFFSSRGLREDLLSWVRTGQFNTVRSN